MANPSLNDRPLLMIPGPTEYDPSVLSMLGTNSLSHVSPTFINEFGESIEMIRKVFLTKEAQPFILSGSGTLGWDFIIANLCEPNDRALVINTGYFSDSFAACCNAYDVQVEQIKADIGSTVEVDQISKVVSKAIEENKKFKIILFTQVDTSTAVLNDIKLWATSVKRIQPDILIAVDGVCSFGGEEFRMDDWQIDCAMTCSQKAIGAPPGLAIIAFSQYALQVRKQRKSKVTGYFIDLLNWLPIMQSYEKRQPSYFATPNVNLIRALRVSLKILLNFKGDGMESVFKLHKETAEKIRKTLQQALGLKLLPTSNTHAANTLSAVWFPKDGDFDKTKFLPALTKHGIIAAGGLHKEVRTEYFRVGHMGYSLWNGPDHILKLLDALESALIESGLKVPNGPGSAQKLFRSL